MLDSSVKEHYGAGTMESLNSLARSISHNLNTYLGIGITASSFNISLINEILSELIDKKSLTEQAKKSLELLLSSNDIVLRNLQRSADVISKLKDSVVVSIDETLIEQNLASMVNDILTCIKNEFGARLNNINIETDISPDIYVSFGANTLWEVLKQLIDNSLVHGFAGSDTGVININAASDGDVITICYSDNGVGMNGLCNYKVFEPFYTTKCDMEYTGLGMTAVYNLVNQSMNGRVRCFDNEMGGMKVSISIRSA